MPQTAARTAARRLVLRQLLERGQAATQTELIAVLRRRGHGVTQATVSRDLAALGASKAGDRYVLAAAGDVDTEALQRRLQQFVVAIDASANIVVLRTAPGSAHAVGVALDAARSSGMVPEVLGTVAGDDTLIAITRAPQGGARLARKLESMME